MKLIQRARNIADALKDHEEALADLPADHPAQVTIKVLHAKLASAADHFGYEIVEPGNDGPGFIAFSGGTNKDDNNPPPPPGGGG